MAAFDINAIRRRLSGVQDSRGLIGQFSRGSNIYNGGLPNATSGPLNPPNPVNPITTPAPVAPPTPEQIPWGQLPFDQYYEAGIRGIQGQEAGLNSQEEIARRRLQEDFTQGGDTLNLGRTNSLRSLSEGMADRGLIHSGINIGEQGQIGQDYLRGVTDLEQGRARSLEDMIRDLTQQRQGLVGDRTALDEGRARDLAAARLEEARKKALADAAAEFAAKFTTTPTGQVMPTQPGQTFGINPVGPGPNAINRRLTSPRR